MNFSAGLLLFFIFSNIVLIVSNLQFSSVVIFIYLKLYIFNLKQDFLKSIL